MAGLDRDEFIVYYQPQFEASNMQLCGAEALIRWRHPDRGILASGNFLKVVAANRRLFALPGITVERRWFENV